MIDLRCITLHAFKNTGIYYIRLCVYMHETLIMHILDHL